MLPSVAVKVTLVEPAGTVTAAGTVRADALLERLTLTPPEPAGCVNTTVQVADAPALRVASAHDIELNANPLDAPDTMALNSTGGNP